MRRVLSSQSALKTYSIPRELEPEHDVVHLRLLARLEVIFLPSSKVSVDEGTGKRNVLSEKILLKYIILNKWLKVSRATATFAVQA